MKEGRLLKKAVRQMYDHRKIGDLLMDTPPTTTCKELYKLV